MVGRAPRMKGLLESRLSTMAMLFVHAALEECEHARIARRLGETSQEAVRPEKAVDLLVVEYDPTQRLQPLILALGAEFARALREISQDHGGLAELLALMH